MKKLLFLFILCFTTTLYAQKGAPHNWQTLDPKADKIYGVGAEQAYKLLAGKTPKTVIVAVIDIGIDIDHEDLKDIIWTNPGEIPDNGIDDDKNGYIDDVHGWSFLGGKNGDINYEATELCRLYNKLNKTYANADTTKFSATELDEYTNYKKIRKEFLTEKDQNEQSLKGIEMFNSFLDKVKKQNDGKITKKGLKKYVPDNKMESRLKKTLKMLITLGLKPEDLEVQVNQGYNQISNTVKYYTLNVDSVRQYLVGDDPNNPNERFYGCNRVKGPDALHGSHVSGIIAAMRNNNIGIIGIANNVKIMPVRAVPNGDERDKDIANAIRYAVDNGATIINMSFGKYYSPDKGVVDEAVKYAQSKDVLLIHAAGNESKNNEVEFSYPCREMKTGETVNNWISVGANSYKKSKNIIGSFSNYGKTRVDFFAPGVDIYSTIADNKYASESGTSMAAPSTTGAAAIIREYFPELKANEVRDILMKSVVPYKKKVKVPGTNDKEHLNELCVTGGFVNVNNAVAELLGLNKKK
jgi:subtilisin family serine protease